MNDFERCIHRGFGADVETTSDFIRRLTASLARARGWRPHAYNPDLTTLAMLLGASLTKARPGSELYECWADRIALAAAYFDRGDDAGVRKWIAEANSYAC
jgi:hypothetical protein